MVATGNVGLAFGLVIAAGASTCLGAALVVFIRKPSPLYLAAALGLSAGVMIYVSLVELFWNGGVKSFVQAGHSEVAAFNYTQLCFFAGAALILVLHWTLETLMHLPQAIAALRQRWRQRQQGQQQRGDGDGIVGSEAAAALAAAGGKRAAHAAAAGNGGGDGGGDDVIGAGAVDAAALIGANGGGSSAPICGAGKAPSSSSFTKTVSGFLARVRGGGASGSGNGESARLNGSSGTGSGGVSGRGGSGSGGSSAKAGRIRRKRGGYSAFHSHGDGGASTPLSRASLECTGDGGHSDGEQGDGEEGGDEGDAVDLEACSSHGGGDDRGDDDDHTQGLVSRLHHFHHHHEQQHEQQQHLRGGGCGNGGWPSAPTPPSAPASRLHGHACDSAVDIEMGCRNGSGGGVASSSSSGSSDGGSPVKRPLRQHPTDSSSNGGGCSVCGCSGNAHGGDGGGGSAPCGCCSGCPVIGEGPGEGDAAPLPPAEGLTQEQAEMQRMLFEVEEHAADLQRMGALTALAIFIHNLPEGITTFVGTLAGGVQTGMVLALAIALHNIPEGCVVAMPIYYATGSKWKAFIWASIAGMAEPFGGLLAYLFLYGDDQQDLYGAVFGIVSGMMVTISMQELLPMAYKFDKDGKLVFWMVMAGFAVMALSLTLLAI